MRTGEASLKESTRHDGYAWFFGVALPWFVGGCSVLVLPAVPGLGVLIPLIIVTLIGLGHGRLRFLCAAAAGFAWTAWHAQLALDDRLSPELAGQDYLLQGYVASFPQRSMERQRFEFVPLAGGAGMPQRIRLSWYEPSFDVDVGQRLSVSVRLKAPEVQLTRAGSTGNGFI